MVLLIIFLVFISIGIFRVILLSPSGFLSSLATFFLADLLIGLLEIIFEFIIEGFSY